MDPKKGEDFATEVRKEKVDSKINGFGSFSGKDMFFRADKIDLKNLDIQLEKKLSKVWIKERSASKKPE